MVRTELRDAREHDEQVEGTAEVAECGREDGPVPGVRSSRAFVDEEHAMGVPCPAREVRVCGNAVAGPNGKVYGVGRQVRPAPSFADGLGLQKGKRAGKCRD